MRHVLAISPAAVQLVDSTMVGAGPPRVGALLLPLRACSLATVQPVDSTTTVADPFVWAFLRHVRGFPAAAVQLTDSTMVGLRPVTGSPQLPMRARLPAAVQPAD